jgi:hypothetical protein
MLDVDIFLSRPLTFVAEKEPVLRVTLQPSQQDVFGSSQSFNLSLFVWGWM